MTGLNKRGEQLVPHPRRRAGRLMREHGDEGRLARRTGEALPGPNPQDWALVNEGDAVAARTGSETVAEAHIWGRDGLVIIEFWIDGVDLPHALSVDLVEQAFAHSAARVHRHVLACLPIRGEGLLEQAYRHIQHARTRTVGLTCLIEGRIREAASPAR